MLAPFLRDLLVLLPLEICAGSERAVMAPS